MTIENYQIGDLAFDRKGNVLIVTAYHISLYNSWVYEQYDSEPPIKPIPVEKYYIENIGFKPLLTDEWEYSSIIVKKYGDVCHVRLKQPKGGCFICHVQGIHTIQQICRIIFKKELSINLKIEEK